MTRGAAGRALPLLAAGALLAGAAACSPRTGEQAPRRLVVEIRGFEYHPDTVEAAVGDTIVWINRDMVPHTATAADRWDSGLIAAGDSASRVVAEEDAAPYVCTYHPNMRGRVVVR